MIKNVKKILQLSNNKNFFNSKNSYNSNKYIVTIDINKFYKFIISSQYGNNAITLNYKVRDWLFGLIADLMMLVIYKSIITIS